MAATYPALCVNKVNWRKIVIEVVKYAIGAVLGGLGVASTGCAAVPVFNF